MQKFVEETLLKKQGEIPPLETRAKQLSQSDMVLTLLRLSAEVETKCTGRKQFLGQLCTFVIKRPIYVSACTIYSNYSYSRQKPVVKALIM